jgi:prepilin-type N-terminal cleavage/methylation domain-containing protein
MHIGRKGVTLIEMVITVVIGLILTSMAISAFAPARRLYTVRSARETLAAMHARTRAHGIEGGTTAVLNIDFGADEASIVRNGTVLETMNFAAMHVDLQGKSSTLQICMNSRGFGEPSCNSFTGATEIVFVSEDSSKRLRVFPLGQLLFP